MHSPPTSYRPLHLVAASSPTTSDGGNDIDDSFFSPQFGPPPIKTNSEDIRAIKNRRRQSTLSYVSASSSTTTHSRRSSLSITSSPPPAGRRPRPLSLALPSPSPTTFTTSPEEDPTPLFSSQPLTITETYAPLLQFIAQKESKCLELRSQLAQHEQELAVLKRKWERIISRHQSSVERPTAKRAMTMTAMPIPIPKEKEKEEDLPPTPELTPCSARSSSSSYSPLSSPAPSTPCSSPPQQQSTRLRKSQHPRRRQPILEDFGATPTLFPNPARLPPSSSNSSSSSLSSAMLPGTALVPLLPELSRYVAPSVQKIWNAGAKEKRRASWVLEGVGNVLMNWGGGSSAGGKKDKETRAKELVEDCMETGATAATTEEETNINDKGRNSDEWNW